MKRLIAMISTGMALGFALALAYADDTVRTDTGSSNDVTMSQPGTMATSTPGISTDSEMPGTMGGMDTMGTPGVSDNSGFEQPGQTGDTTMHGDTSKGMDTTKGMNTSKGMDTSRSEAAKSSKTCTDEAGIIHRSGTEAYTKCMKAKGKTQKEMGGQSGESMEDSKDMSGESGEKSESSY